MNNSKDLKTMIKTKKEKENLESFTKTYKFIKKIREDDVFTLRFVVDNCGFY